MKTNKHITMKTKHALCGLLSGLLLLTAGITQSYGGGPVVPPAGLNPGDQFRVVFITAETTRGNGSQGGYDAFVQNSANAAGGFTYNGTPLTFKALASYGSNPGGIFANTLLPAGTRLALADGTLVTSNLWNGSLLHPINRTAAGNVSNTTRIWTGTNQSGVPNPGANGLGNSSPIVGDNTSLGGWINVGNNSSTNFRPLYAFSNLLSIPVNPPTVTAGIVLAKGGIALNRRTNLWVQTDTLTNATLNPITGPLYLALDGLSVTATLANGAGVSTNVAPLGSPFVQVLGSGGSLAPGAAISAILEFANPTRAGINYTGRILSGGNVAP